jgi:hypothetical protein
MRKRALRKRYDWPPPLDSEDVYVPHKRDSIQSILTALPIIMLVVGLYFFYQGESEQSHQAPIRAQSIAATGVFTGLSVVKAGSRHYLWYEQDGKSHGARVQPEQAKELQALVRGAPVSLRMAPSVSGSSTYWVWYVEQNGTVVIDTAERLQ